jgi:hypothetical protein
VKPAEEWHENDVWELPLGENDNFERKGARLLDLTIPTVNEGKVLDELSKQLSAFSNTGGGQIIYGVTDTGAPDNGGIARLVKGNTTEWLDDVIPILTEFEIVGCKVKEIQPEISGSKLASDKSIYVIDVPDSDRAPHQAKRDLKYYVRLGGKSRPAPHRLIEYIRNRQKHPSLDVVGIQLNILQLPQWHASYPERFAGNVHGEFMIRLKNTGTLMARNSCLHIVSPVGITFEGCDPQTVRKRGTTGTRDDFWELIDPLYTDMEIAFWLKVNMAAQYPPPSAQPPYGGPWLIGGTELPQVKLSWRLFADNAPTKRGEISLNDDLKFDRLANKVLDAYPFARDVRLIFQL